MSPPARAFFRPRGLLVLAVLLVVGLGASAGIFRVAARDVAEGIIGELEARPSVPSEQLDLWLVYGEPQIHNRLQGLRFSPALPALLTHVVEPDLPGGEAAIYGIDLSGARPARIERRELVVEVRLGAPQLLARGPLLGEGAERVPRAAPGLGPDAGRPFAQGVLEWALEPLIEALPRDIEGASLAIVLADEAFPRPAAGPDPAGAGRRRSLAPVLLTTLGVLVGLFGALAFAARRGRREREAADRRA